MAHFCLPLTQSLIKSLVQALFAVYRHTEEALYTRRDGARELDIQEWMN